MGHRALEAILHEAPELDSQLAGAEAEAPRTLAPLTQVVLGVDMQPTQADTPVVLEPLPRRIPGVIVPLTQAAAALGVLWRIPHLSIQMDGTPIPTEVAPSDTLQMGHGLTTRIECVEKIVKR